MYSYIIMATNIFTLSFQNSAKMFLFCFIHLSLTNISKKVAGKNSNNSITYNNLYLFQKQNLSKFPIKKVNFIKNVLTLQR